MPGKKKKSKPTADADPVSDDEQLNPDADAAPAPEDEAEEEHDNDHDGEQPAEGQEEEEEVGEEEEEDSLTREEREAKQRKRRRAVARRKGYRHLATKGGYSTTVPSADASRDVVQNVVSVKEVTRACKWAPALPDKAAYATYEEYAERLGLQNEPLPQGPAAVFRASGEVFLRKVLNESMQRTFDAGKTRVSVNTVMSVLRPLQPLLKFSFVAPTGLVRHAQLTTVGAEGKETPAMGTLMGDDAQITKEEKQIVPQQMALAKAVAKAVAEARKAKEAKEAAKRGAPAAGGPAPAIAKKKKKQPPVKA